MERKAAMELLKSRLRAEVARFYKRDGRLWKQPIVDTLRELQETNARAVFFGGTLRSLLASRMFCHKAGRPRDVDIVVSGALIEDLRERFEEIISRTTRFGGLQLQRLGWQFDVWPLDRTWAFVNDAVVDPEFEHLPSTTFFNLEAIAVEVWASPGKPRAIYSGDDQFFEGLMDRVLEINREENPYPELCVVRALVMSSGLEFQIGPRLAKYVVDHGEVMTQADLAEVQRHHYGSLRREPSQLKSWIEHIANAITETSEGPIRLPLSRQQHLWPNEIEDDRSAIVRIFHSLRPAQHS